VLVCIAVLVGMIVIMVLMTMIVLVRLVAVAMTMMVCVTVFMPFVMIGSALRLERPFDLDDFGTKTLEHVGDDMILPNTQPFRSDLGLQVTVTQMPGKPHLVQAIAALYFQKSLGLGYDLDQPAIFQLISIAVRQRRRFGEVDQHIQPSNRLYHPATPSAVLEAQHDAVRNGLGPDLGGGHEGMSLKHGDPGSADILSALPIPHPPYFQ
jgi:hypothetical protein